MATETPVPIAEYFDQRIYQPAQSLAAIVAGANKFKGVDFAARGRGASPESLSFNWATTEREPSLASGRYIKKEGRGFYIVQAVANLEAAIEGLPQQSGELTSISLDKIADVERFLSEANQMLAAHSGNRSLLMRANTTQADAKNFKPEYAASRQAIIEARQSFDRILSKYRAFSNSYLNSMIETEAAAQTSPAAYAPNFQDGTISRITPYAAATAAVAALYLLLTHTPTLQSNPELQRKLQKAGITAPSPGYEITHGNILRHYWGERLDDLARRNGVPENEIGRWILALARKNNLRATPKNDPFTRANGQLLGNSSDPQQDQLIDFTQEFFTKGNRQMILIAPEAW